MYPWNLTALELSALGHRASKAARSTEGEMQCKAKFREWLPEGLVLGGFFTGDRFRGPLRVIG